MVQKPDFVDDPHFYIDDEGFHLRDGAPPEVVAEFEEFMEQQEEARRKGMSL